LLVLAVFHLISSFGAESAEALPQLSPPFVSDSSLFLNAGEFHLRDLGLLREPDP
jgi:hypothetical protein